MRSMDTSMNSISRTATSTNLLAFRRDGSRRRMTEIIPVLRRCGYTSLDLNFCEMMNPDCSIDASYITALDGFRRTLGVEYVQSHVPYPLPDYHSLSAQQKDRSDADIARAIEYSVRLGVRAIVIHPVRGGIGENVEYLEKFLPLLDGTGSSLALENMERPDEVNSARELLCIVGNCSDSHIGICLDTGHAHLMGHDIPQMIHSLGDRLIATHIADNRGKEDEHLLPFFGTIDWENVMKAFTQTGYSGALAYECMFFTRRLPDPLQLEAVRLSLETAKVLEAMGSAP